MVFVGGTAGACNTSIKRRFGTTGVHMFSVTYAEPKDVFGARSALTFPNFFPKLATGSAHLAVEELAHRTVGDSRGGQF